MHSLTRSLRAPLLSRTLARPAAALPRLARPLSTKDDFNADHSWRQQNHIWSEGEVLERMKTADKKQSKGHYPKRG